MSVKVIVTAEKLNFEGFNEFQQFLEAFCEKPVKKIQFQDDEGDLVSITSDLELKEAQREAKTIGELHLVVSVEESLPSSPVVEQPVTYHNAICVEDPVTYHNAICDSCNSAIRIGIRYKCANCPDFDLCEQCEASHLSQPKHNPEHVFLKIHKPIRFGFRDTLPSLYSAQTQKGCPYLRNLAKSKEEGGKESEVASQSPLLKVEGARCPRHNWHHHHHQSHQVASDAAILPIPSRCPRRQHWNHHHQSHVAGSEEREVNPSSMHAYASRLKNVETQIEELKKLLPPQENKPEQQPERKERKKKDIQDKKKCMRRTCKREIVIELKTALPQNAQPVEEVKQESNKEVQDTKKEVQDTNKEVQDTNKEVQENKKEVQDTKKEVQPQIEEKDQKTMELMDLLLSMGFVDKSLNSQLLAKHGNELNLVVEELLSSL